MAVETNARIEFSVASVEEWEKVNPKLHQGEPVFAKKPSGKYILKVGAPGGSTYKNAVVVWDQDDAETKMTSTQEAAAQALASKNAASASASAAKASENAAAASKSAAATSAENAKTSETNAAASKTAAANSASNSAADASASKSSATASANSATNSANSANSAEQMATASAKSATEASTSASNAATSATNAKASETKAASSASAAAQSAENAKTWDPTLYAKLNEVFPITDTGRKIVETEGLTDLNDIKCLSYPSWLCRLSKTTSKLSNCPTKSSFFLYNIRNGFSSNKETLPNLTGFYYYIVQLFIDINGNVWIRCAFNRATPGFIFTAWVKVATTDDLSSYALKADLPTKTSQLTNDSGFAVISNGHLVINGSELWIE